MNTSSIFESVVFLNESSNLSYRGFKLESDTNLDEYKRDMKSAFKSIDKVYDDMTKDLYNQYTNMLNDDKEPKPYKDFKKILTSKNTGHISVSKNKNIVYIELPYTIKDVGNIIQAVTIIFKYYPEDKSVKWEFDFSD